MKKHFIDPSSSKVARKKRSQAGDMLIEALVAMGLVGVIAMGPAYVASRSAVAQRQAQYQTQAVMQLKNLIKRNGADLCTMSPTPAIVIGTTSLTPTVTCTATTSSPITVGGVAVDITGTEVAQSVRLAVSNQPLFGGAGTIVVAQ
jgi:Tfp pilus assembly protein PilV